MASETDVVTQLRRTLAERVDTDPAHLEAARTDKSGHAAQGRPLAIVHAASVADVVTEVAASTLTERGATRADDRISEAAMEDRKKEGYF